MIKAADVGIRTVVKSSGPSDIGHGRRKKVADGPDNREAKKHNMSIY